MRIGFETKKERKEKEEEEEDDEEEKEMRERNNYTMSSSLLLKGQRGLNRFKARSRTGLLVDLDLGHRSTRQIGTVYRINPRFLT